VNRDTGFAECLAAPTVAPNQADFIALREHYLALFDQVFHRHRLDALIFPQMRSALPGLIDARPIAETTVSEINIAGLPGITVPAGYYESGAPFCLVFVGRPWSEARLLSFAYDYEQATRHRRSPVLESESRCRP